MLGLLHNLRTLHVKHYHATFRKGKDTVIEAYSPPCDIPTQSVSSFRIPNDLFHGYDLDVQEYSNEVVLNM